MDAVTNDHIENVIVKEYYDYKPESNLTLCLLTLKNGFIVHGEAHCLAHDWYDECIGKQRSRANAKDKIWILEAYLLRQKQFECGETFLKSKGDDLSPLKTVKGTQGVNEILERRL